MQNSGVSHFLLLHIFEARIGPTDSNRVFVRRKIRSVADMTEGISAAWLQTPNTMTQDVQRSCHCENRLHGPEQLESSQHQRLTEPTVLPAGIWQHPIHIFYWPCWWLRGLRSVLSTALWPRDPVFASHYRKECISAYLYDCIVPVTSWYLFQIFNSTST